jgi:hypothetical protein
MQKTTPKQPTIGSVFLPFASSAFRRFLIISGPTIRVRVQSLAISWVLPQTSFQQLGVWAS